jgi:carboxypeptidase D
VHQERNWTYVQVYGAGHLIPLYKPEAAYIMARDFIFGSATTGLLTADGVAGGENATLQGAVLPAGPEIYYGNGSTMGTYVAPSATIAAWQSFLASVTATVSYSAVGSVSVSGVVGNATGSGRSAIETGKSGAGTGGKTQWTGLLGAVLLGLMLLA